MESYFRRYCIYPLTGVLESTGKYRLTVHGVCQHGHAAKKSKKGFSLIEHYLERKDVRKEWYELTEKEMKILQGLENLITLVEDEKPIKCRKKRKKRKKRERLADQDSAEEKAATAAAATAASAPHDQGVVTP